MTIAPASQVRRQWSRRRRGHLACVVVALACALGARPAASTELVMYEAAGCGWCRQWHAEIGPGYPNTPEGRLAPLRRHMLSDPPIAGLKLASPVTLTPTFVLADQGREVGRIAGYPGSDFFYPLLDDLLKYLPGAKANPGGTAATKTKNP